MRVEQTELLVNGYWVEMNEAFEFRKRRSEFWAVEIATYAYGFYQRLYGLCLSTCPMKSLLLLFHRGGQLKKIAME